MVVVVASVVVVVVGASVVVVVVVVTGAGVNVHGVLGLVDTHDDPVPGLTAGKPVKTDLATLSVHTLLLAQVMALAVDCGFAPKLA